jgi:hypothetical protein
MLESLTARGAAERWAVAGAFAAVTAVNLVFAWVFAPLLWRMHEIVLDVLSRLLACSSPPWARSFSCRDWRRSGCCLGAAHTNRPVVK